MEQVITSTTAKARPSRFAKIVTTGLLFAGATFPLSGWAGADDVPVHVETSRASIPDRIKVDTKGPSIVATSRITLQPGAATPWHYHPGPHLVSIAAGDVTVYEADCGFTRYTADHGFFDPGVDEPANRRHVHVARNTGTTPAVLLVTDIRPGGGPLRIDVPAPATCF